MREILVACGDVDILRKIVSDLPDGEFKPIATKKGAGIADKLAGRSLAIAIVHTDLADGPSAGLRQALKQQNPELGILLLGTKDADAFADAALAYPIPGPIFRNAINRIATSNDDGEDLEKWRAFYEELGRIVDLQPNQTYYQMLGIKPSAPHHVIVTVYDQLSARYHPDRYAQNRGSKWGDAIYDRANTIYKNLTEAFAILTNRRMRKKYDEKISVGETRLDASDSFAVDTGPSTMDQWGRTPTGKKFLRMAQGEMAKKNIDAAIQNLKFAQSMENSPNIEQKIAELEAMKKSDG